MMNPISQAELELQATALEREPIERDWVRLPNPALLFDIPVDDVHDEFIAAMDMVGSNDQLKVEEQEAIFFRKCDWVLREIIDHSIKHVGENACPAGVEENLGGLFDRTSSRKERAEMYFREWLTLYNQSLRYHEEEYVEALDRAMNGLQEDDSLPPFDLSASIPALLGSDG
jgi:hypothetical protein